jgi:hypothetical protein
VRARYWIASSLPFVVLAFGLAASNCSKDEGTTSSTPPPGAGGSSGSGGSGGSAGAIVCQGNNPLGNVYWGDLHVHTAYSFDAYIGATRAGPDEAYAYARKKAPVSIAQADPTTVDTTIDRPLDFVAVTDHSEFLSLAGECFLLKDQHGDKPACQVFNNQGSMEQSDQFIALGVLLVLPKTGQPPACTGEENEKDCTEGTALAWQRVQEAAKNANDPCSFTTLVAYEWTANTGQANLHRNVIFATDKVPPRPADYLSYPTAFELWQALEATCKAEDGCEVLTIPHNSNSSGGKMWRTTENPEAIPYMKKYQTLVEIYQHKGSSECAPGDTLADPECSFEQLSSNFIGQISGMDAGPGPAGSEPGMVRNGLATGLTMQASGGGNPLEMGIIGSTDTHNAIPGAVKEDEWPGHIGVRDDTTAGRLSLPEFGPGGITGVWAPQNTREEIFGALRRRETFATSGPRIPVRMYVSTTVKDDEAAKALCADPSFPQALVAGGASPMGRKIAAGGTPYIFVSAMKDETALDAVDVVKLSSDGTSAAQELFSTTLGPDDRDHPCVFFRDPNYDATRPTLYYARVYQEPTYRWSHYDCQKDPSAAPEKCAGEPDAGAPLDVQIRERAWTSPVWVIP